MHIVAITFEVEGEGVLYRELKDPNLYHLGEIDSKFVTWSFF